MNTSGNDSSAKIDELLKAEFNLSDNESDEENEVFTEESENVAQEEKKETVDEDNLQESDADDLNDEQEKSDETDKDDEENAEEKPSKDDKKEYAFADLRKKLGEAEKERDLYKNDNEFLENLALMNGYTDVNKFKEDIEAAKLEKEAKAKGINPEHYKENIQLKKRIEILEMENQKEKLFNKAQILKDVMDKAVIDYGLKDRSEIISRLDENGITPELLLETANPRPIIDGVLLDKVQEKIKQEALATKEKAENLSDEANNGGHSTKTFNLDDFVKNSLKNYTIN